MGKRQVVTIDITFDSGYGELNATKIMEMLIAGNATVKSISIKVVNKRKEIK